MCDCAEHEGRGELSFRGEVLARFENDALMPLWETLHRRFEHAGDRPVRRVRIAIRDDFQRRWMADLLGLDRMPTDHVTVPVDKLDVMLDQAVPGLDTRTAVEFLCGPIDDVAARRRGAAMAREGLWRWLDEHPVVCAEPALQQWADDMRRAGIAGGSVARTHGELQRALDVLAALPGDGRPLPSFAQATCGDPHALDDNTRLSNRVLRAVAVLRDCPVPTDAESRRALWEAVGVACDTLSTAVLVAGLRPVVEGPLGATLRAWADAGQAAWITMAQLRTSRVATGEDDLMLSVLQPSALPVAGRERVWVVENPSVVAEALGRFGAACPPIVCTSGWPTSAAIQLLRDLTAGGAALRYHGDLDGEGVRIAAHVMQRTSAVPYAMSAADYRGRVGGDGPSVGRVTDAPWDSALAPAMHRHGVAVTEEQVCDELLTAMAEEAA
jgi:uncharacterized protein (TIGR02679 family)